MKAIHRCQHTHIILHLKKSKDQKVMIEIPHPHLTEIEYFATIYFYM